jgi:hypothetical protein
MTNIREVISEIENKTVGGSMRQKAYFPKKFISKVSDQMFLPL